MQSAMSYQLNGDLMAIKIIIRADQPTAFNISSKNSRETHTMGELEVRGLTLF